MAGRSGRLGRARTAAACAAAVLLLIRAAPLSLGATGRHAAPAGMVHIPAGSYVPLYTPPRKEADRTRGAAPANRVRRTVTAFDLDVLPVTNADYLGFVKAHPEWRRSAVKRINADASYLKHWRGDLDPGDDAPAKSPVVYVSWFAARAYLASVGKRLPTVDQWEYVAAASERARDASREPAFLERLRQWYGMPTPARLPSVGSGSRNIYGVADLHGLVWEWTLDFNSSLVTGESRADASLDRSRYCGSGAAGASDFEDYAAFMRYAFRSSLEARYSIGNLGFRGVTAHGE